MVQDTDYISIDFNMSRTYCSWINKVFNSLIYNLFKNIDLCMFCMRAQFGAYWPPGCSDLRGGDLRAPGRRSQRHTYWPSWPCGHKDHLCISIMVSMYCIGAAVTRLLELGKSSNIFAWVKSASERASFEYRWYTFQSKTRPSNCRGTEWRANLFFSFTLFTFFLTLQSVIVVVMQCFPIFLLFTIYLCKYTEAETIHLQSNEVISST